MLLFVVYSLMWLVIHHKYFMKEVPGPCYYTASKQQI